ncbi:uncharacterized protein N7511_007108 [Penicillium nucicola]|uniref:uncharacterized protein n=1 Tax=Penicillium nucicola TaxID=1850975 RepID=UPI00254518C1|nr:uncharacterized protein N7511_007108 [Penicillium nucicola]KAJ5756926.1 hypothetical protein N7511_007108 [Penicillium nucicola]
MATNLTAPDSHKGSRVAVGASPGQDVAVGSLDNGKDVTGTLVGHDSGERGERGEVVTKSTCSSVS